MNTSTKHDKQLTELVNVWSKLSAWNKAIVFMFAIQAVIKQKLKLLLRSGKW